jgi:uncharacterized protein (TIGR03437 family)
MKTIARIALLVCLSLSCVAWAQNSPVISLVANAEGEKPLTSPNTWVEIKGQNLSRANDTRVWQGTDFVNNQMPTSLDGVSVTVNGKSAFVYYISPTQVNVLTPPDALTGTVTVQVTRNGLASAPFSVSALPLSPSFFVFNGGPYAVATHADGSLAGPASLYPGSIAPAKPGETIVLYGNGFGLTSTPVVNGSISQSGTLSPLPTVTIGGAPATVAFAGLISPGLFQLNVVIPVNTLSGDNPVIATINGTPTTPAALIVVQGSAPPPASVTFYVAPNGSDFWSGRLAAPNSTNTDGPFATLDRARAFVQSIVKAGLTRVTVQLRGGTYYLPATAIFTAADSGTAAMPIVYQKYPGESPVFSGGVRVQNWTNTGDTTWRTDLPANTQYFESLFYNGTRRLRPRLGSGYLGSYFRSLNTVYLNSAPPPAAAPNANCSVYVTGSGWECFDRFQYNSADPISAAWKNLAPAAGNPCGQPAGNPSLAGDIEVLDFEQFSTSILRISCIDTKNQIVYMTGPTVISQVNYTEEGFIAGNRYLVENVQDQLSQPGQWFLDHSATPWTLTYLSNSGENPNTDSVIVPQTAQLLVASGLQYVTFQGLTFEHDNYTVPPLGHQSAENESNATAALSFQNSQHITFDSGTVTQTTGAGLEFISCVSSGSPVYCASNSLNAVTANDTVQNSAFYDIGVQAVRIGGSRLAVSTDENTPQSITVQNNVVEGYGRMIPAAFGIGQGAGHDNLYTHNDVYDGYHCAVSISQGGSDTARPNGNGNSNNTLSFNHVYNLLQGIMNDGGSIRIEGGNQAYTAPGNRILNNKIHDVTDSSIQDANGYGGHGIYMDNDTGLVDVENNLVYRVSGIGIYTPHGPAGPNEANTIKNNIVAFARLAMIADNFPYVTAVPAAEQAFVVTNNLFYFDRTTASSPPFRAQAGCVYTGGLPFPAFQQFNNNLYWRTDGAFASDTKAFHVQLNASSGPDAPCSGNASSWTFYTFSAWQQTLGEDQQSVVQNPGFANPAYPADDYSLPKGSPGAGFVVFDPNQAGRTNPVIKPPAVAATFPTKTYNPATDY